MLRFIAQMLEGHREAQAYGKRPGSGEGICMYIHMYACMCVCMHRCECGHNKFFGTRNGTGTECKNRKKRNRSQGGRSPQFCVCIMLHVCGCTVGWLAGWLGLRRAGVWFGSKVGGAAAGRAGPGAGQEGSTAEASCQSSQKFCASTLACRQVTGPLSPSTPPRMP